MLVLAGVALPVAATYLLLQPLRRGGASIPFTSALAIGLGLGIASCTFFLALVLFDGRRVAAVGIDAVVLLVALIVWRRSGAAAAASRKPFTPREGVLAVAVLVAAAAAATSFIANTLELPHGRWDAWATWNVRARFLADAGSQWRGAFGPPAIHGGYPLLVPSTVARLWVYASTNDTIAPATVAAAYAAALVLLLYAALAALRTRTQGLVGALCLLGTPVFLRVVPWQYADVPLAFNLLAAVACFALYDRDPARGRPLLLWAGVAMGLAAWTKNEGQMLVVGVVIARGVLMLVQRRVDLRSAGYFVAGLLPPGVIVFYFKTWLSPHVPQFRRDRSMLSQLLDLGRYEAILRSFGFELLRGTLWVALGLVIYALLLGRSREQASRRSAASVAAILAFAGLAYFFTYLTARPELGWLLSYSMDRLQLQLWPSALLAVLLYVASPAEREAAAPPSPPAMTPAPEKGRSRRRERARR